ncbi:MAG: archaeosortase/exosortase family protein [Syntrophorhabdales bacterium]
MVRSERFRFAVAFGLACLGFHALVLVLPSSFYRVICEHTARTMTLVLDAFGFPVVACSNIVSGGGLLFQIVLECTALSMVGLFICFVCFYHAEAHRKTIGLAMGIPALYLGNLARLVLIFVVSWHNPGLFGIVHVYLGQVFTMLLVILACILWLRWVNTGSPPGPFFLFRPPVVLSAKRRRLLRDLRYCYVRLANPRDPVSAVGKKRQNTRCGTGAIFPSPSFSQGR